MSEKKRYRVIYADPPWYTPGAVPSTRSKTSTWIRDRMALMKDKDIMAMGKRPLTNCDNPTDVLPAIEDLQADNGVLFMWCIASKIEEGIQTVNAWGYRFIKPVFAWVKTSELTGKPKPTIGTYSHTCVEYCLLGVRGKGQLPHKRGIKDAQCLPRARFAEKPAHFRELIDVMYPEGHRLEIFSRHTAEGWDMWGNEVGKLDSPEALA